MDLSKLSNEDLTALSTKNYDKLSNEGLSFLNEQNQSKPESDTIPGAKQAHNLSDILNNAKAFSNYNPSQQEISKASQNPDTGMDDPAYQLAGLVSPSSIMGLSGKIGGVARKLGDNLMQRSMGATKIVPGLGEDFANAGMIGTKSQMAGQAERGLEKSGQAIGDLASKIPGTIPQDEVANKVAEVAGKRMTPSGFVRPEEQAIVDRTMNKAVDFANAEPLTGAETAARRAQAGQAAREARGYAQTPSSTLKAQQAVAEQAGHSEALKNAYQWSFPDAPNALADADKQYSTFAKADQLLSKPEPTGSLGNFMSQITPTSLMESAAGRAAIGGGKTIQRTPIGAVPLTLKGMFSPKDDQ